MSAMNAMHPPRPSVVEGRRPERSEGGFTLIETLIALLLMLIVMGGAVQSMIQFSRTQATTWNRANMHGSIRSATELLQQEVGQAGRVSLPATMVMWTWITAPGTNTVTVSTTDPVTPVPTAGLFVGEQLVIDTGDTEETVTVSAINSAYQFTAYFAAVHVPAGGGQVPISVRGGFATGVVPCASAASCPGSTVASPYTNGSTGSVLKIYGDINGDGNMVYVEYVCDPASRSLYRNMMAYNAASKQAQSPSQTLLSNVLPNPGGTACFTYDQKTVNGVTYVVNVAVSLTTQTQMRDATTRQFQTETKALLNVAPRNVFDAWELASIGSTNRIQPMPASVTALLHD